MPIPFFVTEQEKSCARSKSELNDKDAQKLWPQWCKLPSGYRIKNITKIYALELFEAAKKTTKMKDFDSFSF